MCTKRSSYNQLKRANFVWVSARSQHPNADPLKQEEFKKISEKVKAVLRENIDIKSVETWSTRQHNSYASNQRNTIQSHTTTAV